MKIITNFLLLFVLFNYNNIYAQISYTTPINENSISINQNLTVSKISGGGSITSYGAATYEIPISLPPGTKNIIPDISIIHNSMINDGILGHGWSISGISSITRIPQTYYRNNNSATVDLTNNDRFALNGVKLALKENSTVLYGGFEAIYKTEEEETSEIKSYGNAGTGPLYFEVIYENGTKIEYGKTSNSRFLLTGSTSVFEWKINKIIDNNGNYIDFNYITVDNEIYIDEIKYTGNINSNLQPYNKIKFMYNDRNDKSFYYIGGCKLNKNKLLTKIEIYAENQLRDYFNFNYIFDLYSNTTKLNEILRTINSNIEVNSTKVIWNESNTTELFQSFVDMTGICTNCAHKYCTGDFNGDGKTDILVAEGNMNGSVFNMSKRILFISDNNYVSNTFIKYETNYSLSGFVSYTAMDIDNDGIDEIIEKSTGTGGSDNNNLFKYNSTNVWNTYNITINQGNLTTPTNSIFITEPYKNIKVDFNGDGRNDFFSVLSNSTGLNKILISGNNGFDEKTTSINLSSYSNYSVNLIDYNGNGKTDIAILCNTGIFIYEYNNNIFSLIFNNSSPSSNQYILFGDYNGDKKTDVLYCDNYTGRTPQWKIIYSLGIGGYTNPVLINNIDFVDYLAYSNKFEVLDIDKDGKSDIIESKANGSINLYISNSNSFRKITNTTVNNNFNYPFLYGDFNGDNRIDLFEITNSSNLAMSCIKFQPFNKSGFVKAVYDGFKNKYIFEYKPLTDPSVYNKNLMFSSYPAYAHNPYAYSDMLPNQSIFTPIQPTYFVASKIMLISKSNDTTISSNYYYEGFNINKPDNNKFLGFNFVSINDDITKVKSESAFDFMGIFYKQQLGIQRTYVYNTLGTNPGWVNISESWFSNVFNVNPANYSIDNLRCSYSNDMNYKEDYIKNITINNSIDLTYSTPPFCTMKRIEEISSFSDGIISRKEIHTKKEATTFPNWQNSRLQSEKIIITYNSQPSYTRTKNYTYDPVSGNLTKIQYDILDNDNNISTEFSDFNEYGEPLKITTIPPVNNSSSQYPVDAKIEYLEYDAYGKHVISSTKVVNGNNFVELFNYEPNYGNLIKYTDANSKEINYEYDELGRKTLTIFADQTYESINYSWATTSNDPSNSLFKTIISTSGNPDVTKWIDCLGREIKNQTININNTKVWTINNYNKLNQITSSSLPFFENSTPVFASYSYDFLGRKLQENLPDATVVKYIYNDKETTIQTIKNNITQQKKQKEDGIGNIIKVTELDNNNSEINYQYNSQGLLVNTTNGAGCAKVYSWIPQPGGGYPPPPPQYTYDLRGNVLTSNNPNIGSFEYKYDAYGRLRKKIDNSQKITLFTYDEIDRITSTDIYNLGGNHFITSYIYDTKNDGFGKIATINCNWNSISNDFEYDSYGRLRQKTERVDGKEFSKDITYNNDGKLNSFYYLNDNIDVTYDYAYGQLSTVNLNGNSVWQANTQDNFGNYTSYTLGNNLTTLKSIDPNTGRLTNLKTGVLPSSFIQDYNYSYDNMGNLTMKNDIVNTQKEVFSYDNLNRLTEINFYYNNVLDNTKNLSYCDNGNIDEKSDVGSYHYGNSTQFYTNLYGISSIDPLIANINTNRDITFTPFNQPKLISEPDAINKIKELEFVYGTDFNRCKTTEKYDNQTIKTKYFALDNYEESLEEESQLITKDYYIYAGDGLAAIYRITDINGVDDNPVSNIYYVHKDNLGSFDLITDNAQNIVEKFSFDAWGIRRNHDLWSLADNTTHTFSRGFTGHEHLDQFELINMNGRIFDPVTARFLSPDPIVQNIFNSQNYNRYSYCLNNPLRYTDPSGFVYEGGNPNQIYQEDVIDLSEFFEMSMQDLSYWMEYGVKQREEVAIFTDYNSFNGFGGGGQGPSEFFDLFNSLKNNPLLADLFGGGDKKTQKEKDKEALMNYYKFQMKINSPLSRDYFNAFLNYYLNATENEEKFVKFMEKPCVIVGQGIANMSPVTLMMHIKEGKKSGFKRNYWGTVNVVDNLGTVGSTASTIITFFPFGDKYGTTIDLTLFFIDIFNGRYKEYNK